MSVLEKINTQSSFFTLAEIAEGVFAAVIKAGTGAMGNAAIVDLGDRTVVFDTMYTPKAGLALREAAEQLLGRPVSLVINSHFHFDHVGGNQVFSDAIILSTETTKNLMLERCTSLVQFAKQHPEYPDKVRQSLEAESDPEKQKELRTDLGDILALDAALPTFSATPASLTFSDSVTLHGSKRTAVLTAKGNGHSTCDSVLYLPEDRVLLAGDLLFVQNHPSMQTGNLSHWVSVLKAWKDLPISAAVGGHGPVGDHQTVDSCLHYLEALWDQAKHLAENGSTPEAIEAIPIPEPYASWSYPSLFARNLQQLSQQILAVSE
ncbi:MBL fold metallo-hydrolase [Brevibacillus borstelensis]|uniref:MBL fold metallo-hydrolase n=1 Tax=Brevibacillus TaxID=55080 RepID=UPI0004689B44|nr:MBL fold metallo-hydrolase [Brevibacillus borstelensis]MBE5396211.1 MBL fold metallo-hydrolase [Brevibacillus borstelensis]MCC0563117.1 MBL fold metallo-hydrolase [Brevibacillus borstelensis]MCM3469060.1 MBL fold metallo-hydrolase [Brevibacillus borstelensis]MCM3558456.1 MBL fold metallo-hydrolase [Brevibacillus borstelensis]MCM3590420.1 MBL fold metallo-hydrolase [Brevibacillus borstelensis]